MSRLGVVVGWARMRGTRFCRAPKLAVKVMASAVESGLRVGHAREDDERFPCAPHAGRAVDQGGDILDSCGLLKTGWLFCEQVPARTSEFLLKVLELDADKSSKGRGSE